MFKHGVIQKLNNFIFNDKLQLIIVLYLFPGIPYQQRSVRLNCVIECFPLCDIVWHHNGKPIPIHTERSNNGVIQASGSFDTYSKFVVRTEQKPPDHSENILEHVESDLTIVSPLCNFFSKIQYAKPFVILITISEEFLSLLICFCANDKNYCRRKQSIPIFLENTEMIFLQNESLLFIWEKDILVCIPIFFLLQ